MRRITVVNRSDDGGAAGFVKLLKLCTAEAAGLLSVEGKITVAIVDDPEMRELNLAYRNISRTTDVLSFGNEQNGVAGDIVISIETARRRARLYEITIEDELKELVVHSVAHLAGHTHKRKKDNEKMWAEELRVLKAIAKI